jgi:predicted nucleic acid-binding protein
VPAAVVEELRHPHAVATVRAWLTDVPAWLLVQHVDEGSDARLARLDRGERHAIQLATREHADLLLMDEKLGVRIAREQGLAVTGTWGFCCRPLNAGWWKWSRRSPSSRARTSVAAVE